MVSLRARVFELVLPLLGIKRFFSQPDRMDERIAKMRRAKSPRPGKNVRRDFAVREGSGRGYPLITLEPLEKAEATGIHLLYFHGGGYVMDIAALHWEAVAELCRLTGASASVPIYPLAPEVTAETTLPAMRALYDELAQQHGADNIAVAGDSAGGGMALALAQDVAKDGKPMPGSLTLFSPWVDASASGEGMAAIEHRDKMLSPQGLEACGERYAGGLALDDTRLSPLFGELDNLPPTSVFVGTRDILLVDARRLRERMDAAGRPPNLYREAEHMQHVWMILPIPEGKAALRDAASFITSTHSGTDT